MGFSPGSQGLALALAWPLIYHSLKLSYLLLYLPSASSLWNATSTRPGTLPPLCSALDQDWIESGKDHKLRKFVERMNGFVDSSLRLSSLLWDKGMNTCSLSSLKHHHSQMPWEEVALRT